VFFPASRNRLPAHGMRYQLASPGRIRVLSGVRSSSQSLWVGSRTPLWPVLSRPEGAHRKRGFENLSTRAPYSRFCTRCYRLNLEFQATTLPALRNRTSWRSKVSFSPTACCLSADSVSAIRAFFYFAMHLRNFVCTPVVFAARRHPFFVR